MRYRFSKKDRRTGATEYWFSDAKNPADRFMLDESLLGASEQFLKENQEIDALVFNERIVSVTLPIKINLVVREAPPNVRGNTSQGGTKVITLETGATVTTPMFIEAGDTIEVNTETGEYVRRVE